MKYFLGALCLISLTAFLISCYRGDNAKILLSNDQREAYEKARQINRDIEAIAFKEKEIDDYVIALKSNDTIISNAARRVLLYYRSVSFPKLLQRYSLVNCSDTLIEDMLLGQMDQGVEIPIDSMSEYFQHKKDCIIRLFFKANNLKVQKSNENLSKEHLSLNELVELYQRIPLKINDTILRSYRRNVLKSVINSTKGKIDEHTFEIMSTEPEGKPNEISTLKCDFLIALTVTNTVDLTDLISDMLLKSQDTTFLQSIFFILSKAPLTVNTDSVSDALLLFIKKRNESYYLKEQAVRAFIKLNRNNSDNALLRILSDKDLALYYNYALCQYDSLTITKPRISINSNLMVMLKSLFNNEKAHPIITKLLARSNEFDYLIGKSKVNNAKYKTEISKYLSEYFSSRRVYKKIIIQDGINMEIMGVNIPANFLASLKNIGYFVEENQNDTDLIISFEYHEIMSDLTASYIEKKSNFIGLSYSEEEPVKLYEQKCKLLISGKNVNGNSVFSVHASGTGSPFGREGISTDGDFHTACEKAQQVILHEAQSKLLTNYTKDMDRLMSSLSVNFK